MNAKLVDEIRPMAMDKSIILINCFFSEDVKHNSFVWSL